jgi:hypothetical protein
MAKPYFHSQSSAKKYGGIWEDYMEIHEFMDSSKAAFPDNRHRALTHNSWFIGTVLPKVFGETFRRKSDNKIVCTRDIGEQHVLEDYKFKFIPTVQDFLQEMDFLPWMQNGMGEGPTSHKKIEGTKSINDLKKVEAPIEVAIPPQTLSEIKFDPSKDEEISKSIKETLERLGKEERKRGPMVFDGRRPSFGRDDTSMTID